MVMVSGAGVLELAGLPNFKRIVADSDLDGLCAAAVLKAANPNAQVVFAHAALIRSGAMDSYIDENTAIVDLPFHENCGWYLDHHLTNRPSPKQEEEFIARGGVCHWEATPSAARLAYDLLSPVLDLNHLNEIMPIVDALDSGGISKEDFLADGKVLQLSRSLSLQHPEHLQNVLNLLSSGLSLKEILQDEKISQHVDRAKSDRILAQKVVEENTTIVDRLAICRMDEKGVRSNGYLVTAWAGENADACCIIHGYSDGAIETPDRPALSASFYANSFIENGQDRYDLSRLATSLDPTGGGHANACGCRVSPAGIESDMQHWIDIWRKRDSLLRLN
jgi:oligoribonuclease NrnB/cAMP/cGMP phosphodiesterase (DHH superfamily)